MKEIEIKQPEPQEQHPQQQLKKGIKYKRSVVLKPGHKIFEISLITGECMQATYESVNIDFGTKQVVKKLIENKDCVYIPALNKKNAQRKFDAIVNRVIEKRTKGA